MVMFHGYVSLPEGMVNVHCLSIQFSSLISSLAKVSHIDHQLNSYLFYSNLDAWRLQFGASFLLVQTAMLGTTGRCREARFVFHCHAVWVWRRRSFRAVAAGRFEAWRLNLDWLASTGQQEQEGLGARARRQEKAAARAKRRLLVSCWFRQQR